MVSAIRFDSIDEIELFSLSYSNGTMFTAYKDNLLEEKLVVSLGFVYMVGQKKFHRKCYTKSLALRFFSTNFAQP